jgi:DNA-binding MarR family transcriptional regulator
MVETVVGAQSAWVARAVRAAKSLARRKGSLDDTATPAGIERRGSTAIPERRYSRCAVHRNQAGERASNPAGAPAGSTAAEPLSEGSALERFLDVMDRERLAPVEALVLLRLAAADATVSELASGLNREPATIRRSASDLIGRGLLRRRAASRGHVLQTTLSGLAALGRLKRPPQRLAPPAR